MRKPKTEEESYKSCQSGGFFKNLRFVNKERVRSLVRNADTNVNSAKKLAETLSKEDQGWMNVYTMHYEALRICIEALMIFDKTVSNNHECLFACLCVNHPELEFDWNFFEKIRTKRNGVNYYGEQVSYNEWKAVELQFTLYISSLKKGINERLGESEENEETAQNKRKT
ncbi:hypothetical protein HYW20_09160 [Candidatus Woesearchaeota archaeon]|nr:hypothetical protein [Candidatus Woesearchaeota archaeon]